jgi:hypothetical protein
MDVKVASANRADIRQCDSFLLAGLGIIGVFVLGGSGTEAGRIVTWLHGDDQAGGGSIFHYIDMQRQKSGFFTDLSDAKMSRLHDLATFGYFSGIASPGCIYRRDFVFPFML